MAPKARAKRVMLTSCAALQIVLACDDPSQQVDCARIDAPCTLAETARRVGVEIGAAVASPTLEAERATIPSDFTSVTPENAMKWGELASSVGDYDFAAADAIADFAMASDVRLRGHALVWREQLPGDIEAIVEASAEPEERLTELINDHISTVVPRYRGIVSVWDVVNEPLSVASGALDTSTLFGRVLGEAYIDLAFRRARELDPDAHLVLNEYVLTYDVDSPFWPKSAGLLELVKRLLDRGVPIDGVGIQAHFNGLFPDQLPLPTREQFEAYLSSLGELGVTVEITELDVSISYFSDDPDPLASQADFYANIFGACMAVPACTGVTTWGITDARTWLDSFALTADLAPHRPLLFDEALNPKPAYFAVRSAIAERAPSD